MPLTVTKAVSAIEEMPRMSRELGAASTNHRVAAGGIERVAHQDGDVAHTHGKDGGGIDHFSTKVTQLGGFVVREFVDGERRGDNSRIGRHKTIDIGPDFEHFCSESGGEDGGCVVRSATAKIGGAAAFYV